MVRYLTPQLKRTYDRVVRKLMPWRMIDALETLDEAARRSKDGVPAGDARDGQDGDDPGASSTRT